MNVPEHNTNNIDLSGIKVRFSQRGKGKSLLLLHGGEGSFEDKNFFDHYGIHIPSIFQILASITSLIIYS